MQPIRTPFTLKEFLPKALQEDPKASEEEKSNSDIAFEISLEEEPLYDEDVVHCCVISEEEEGGEEEGMKEPVSLQDAIDSEEVDEITLREMKRNIQKAKEANELIKGKKNTKTEDNGAHPKSIREEESRSGHVNYNILAHLKRIPALLSVMMLYKCLQSLEKRS